MTEAQAHEFVTTWDKKFYPWRLNTEVEVANRLRSTLLGIMGGMVGVALTSFGEWIVEVCTAILFCFFLWLYLRLQKAG